jgi:hypothetical protein
MLDFHIDDSWDILTSGGSFLDHNASGPTLYGADIMVHPTHQHHGLAYAMTDQARYSRSRRRTALLRTVFCTNTGVVLRVLTVGQMQTCGPL